MSYKEGIIKAIKELNAGDGSTVVRIKKFMEENDLPANEQTWNNRVFHLSLESLVLVGDLGHWYAD
jgi:tRNA (Thr-GGU) A37 N-methylase